MGVKNINVRRRLDGKIEVSTKAWVTWPGLYVNESAQVTKEGDLVETNYEEFSEVRSLEWLPVFISADPAAVAAFISANDFAPRSAGDGFGASLAISAAI